MAFEKEIAYGKYTAGIEGYVGVVVERKMQTHYYKKPEFHQVDNRTGHVTTVGGGTGTVSEELVRIQESNGRVVNIYALPFECRTGQTISIFYNKQAGYSIDENDKKRANIFYARNHTTNQEFSQCVQGNWLTVALEIVWYFVLYGAVGIAAAYVLFMIFGDSLLILALCLSAAGVRAISKCRKRRAVKVEIDRQVIDWCKRCASGTA